MEAGFKVFSVCLDSESGKYSGYCEVANYCDICVCGKLHSETGAALRNSCFYCRTSLESLAYEIQRLSLKFNIHHSWLSFGFASALYILHENARAS